MKDLHYEGEKEVNILDSRNVVSSEAGDDPTRINQIDRKKEHLETLKGNVRGGEREEDGRTCGLGRMPLRELDSRNPLHGFAWVALVSQSPSRSPVLERRPKSLGD